MMSIICTETVPCNGVTLTLTHSSVVPLWILSLSTVALGFFSSALRQFDSNALAPFVLIIDAETLTLDGNQLRTRVPDSVCELRSRELQEFVVDCPVRAEEDILGVICGIPTCCSACRPFGG